MSEPRFYVDRDASRYDEQGAPNKSELLRSWFVVDSAPGKPYGVVVAEFFVTPETAQHAEEWANDYAKALDRSSRR
jgi:hypothetical protein